MATGEEGSLSLNRPVSASSSFGGSGGVPPRPPRNANDGDSATRWSSERPPPATQAQFWQVDLEATRRLGRVTLTWSDTEFARDYRVETSTDGVTFTARDMVTAATRGGTRTHRFAAPIDARYVRISMTAPAPEQTFYTLEEVVAVGVRSRRTRGDHEGDMVCQSGQRSNRVICGVVRQRNASTSFLDTSSNGRLVAQKEWSRNENRAVIRRGDSGGPVFVPRDRGQRRLTIIGINSYGFGPVSPDADNSAFRSGGFSHIAFALRLSKTKVCTPRTCRSR